jgi:DNA (cytosine-5)-methyltransferase 1
MKSISRNILIGIDIFSGAGGMSLGAENAGIQVISAVELNKYFAGTYALNFKKTKMLEKYGSER